MRILCPTDGSTGAAAAIDKLIATFEAPASSSTCSRSSIV